MAAAETAFGCEDDEFYVKVVDLRWGECYADFNLGVRGDYAFFEVDGEVFLDHERIVALLFCKLLHLAVGVVVFLRNLGVLILLDYHVDRSAIIVIRDELHADEECAA